MSMFFFFFDIPQSNNGNGVSTTTPSTNPGQVRRFRIHGDNIVECERTLNLIRGALHARVNLLTSPLYKPKYQLQCTEGTFEFELLSGHERWGVDIGSILIANGGILSEGADSYVTEIKSSNEEIIFALEYCSALPAGNNAWQRSGRALSSVLAGVPYIYFAEIGGVELDEQRNVKAPRFPNPVVPFSYLKTSDYYNSICLPVYNTHPTITPSLGSTFANSIGTRDCANLIRCLLLNLDKSAAISALTTKGINLVKALAAGRRSVDTLRNAQWDGLFSSTDSANWLCTNSGTLLWKKKLGNKVQTTATFNQLFTAIINLGCKTIGGKNLPICLVPISMIPSVEAIMNRLYPSMSISFAHNKPLAIVWITGFKPRGDDSRPDRGLTSLARMTIGQSANLLSVVYGPAKPATWRALSSSVTALCNSNGLWQSIFKLSDYVFVDSFTAPRKYFFSNTISITPNGNPVTFPYQSAIPVFGENDTDCAIHQIFAHKSAMGILEGLCNPPGGDWSGISVFEQNDEYRWTSLPRVSQIGGKRPDHVIQIATSTKNYFLSIESKGYGSDLDNNIGHNLKSYLIDLFSSQPTAHRAYNTQWSGFTGTYNMSKPYTIYSVGAFEYRNVSELFNEQTRGRLDAIIAFEFSTISKVHVLDRTQTRLVEKALKKIQNIMSGFVIQVH